MPHRASKYYSEKLVLTTVCADAILCHLKQAVLFLEVQKKKKKTNYIELSGSGGDGDDDDIIPSALTELRDCLHSELDRQFISHLRRLKALRQSQCTCSVQAHLSKCHKTNLIRNDSRVLKMGLH